MLPVKLHLLVKALNAPLGKAPSAAQLSHGNLWLCNLNSRRGHQRVKDDKESKGSHLLISLSPSLCCSLNNVICRGMWVSGALLSSGESNHTPFTHTHFNHPLSRVSFLHLPRRLTRCVTSCIFHKVWAAWSIFHICY